MEKDTEKLLEEFIATKDRTAHQNRAVFAKLSAELQRFIFEEVVKGNTSFELIELDDSKYYEMAVLAKDASLRKEIIAEVIKEVCQMSKRMSDEWKADPWSNVLGFYELWEAMLIQLPHKYIWGWEKILRERCFYKNYTPAHKEKVVDYFIERAKQESISKWVDMMDWAIRQTLVPEERILSFCKEIASQNDTDLNHEKVILFSCSAHALLGKKKLNLAAVCVEYVLEFSQKDPSAYILRELLGPASTDQEKRIANALFGMKLDNEDLTAIAKNSKSEEIKAKARNLLDQKRGGRIVVQELLKIL